MQQQSFTKSWQKSVILDPLNSLHFNMDLQEQKPTTILTVKNGSDHVILFKVKTTNPVNYSVRPSQGVVKVNQEFTIKVIFNFGLDTIVSD